MHLLQRRKDISTRLLPFRYRPEIDSPGHDKQRHLHDDRAGTPAVGGFHDFLDDGFVVVLRHVDEVLCAALADELFFGASIDADNAHSHTAARELNESTGQMALVLRDEQGRMYLDGDMTCRACRISTETH